MPRDIGPLGTGRSTRRSRSAAPARYDCPRRRGRAWRNRDEADLNPVGPSGHVIVSFSPNRHMLGWLCLTYGMKVWRDWSVTQEATPRLT